MLANCVTWLMYRTPIHPQSPNGQFFKTYVVASKGMQQTKKSMSDIARFTNRMFVLSSIFPVQHMMTTMTALLMTPNMMMPKMKMGMKLMISYFSGSVGNSSIILILATQLIQLCRTANWSTSAPKISWSGVEN